MIKMKTAVSGESFSISSGQITDFFDEEQEKRFVDAGLAEYVKINKKKTKKKGR